MMPENESQNEEQNEHGLIPGGALPEISAKSSGPLDEMVERSLVSIRTSKELSTKHRIGEHELYGPDYRLVCVWAEELGMSEKEILRILLEPRAIENEFMEFVFSTIKNGRFRKLWIDHSRLPVTSLMPKIEGLVVEEISGCGFTALDLCLLPNLTALYFNYNQLAELDLRPVPNLTHLGCYHNKLTALDLRPVPKLTHLWCYENHLTSLYLSAVPNLTWLWCSTNQLTDLDLSPVPNLTELWCHENHLTALDLSAVPNLTQIQCDKNQLTDLDLRPVPNLVWLRCTYNHLTALDLSAVPNLTELDCSYNQLTNLDLSPVPHLSRFRCGNNQLTELDIRPEWMLLKSLEYDKDKTRLIQRSDQNF